MSLEIALAICDGVPRILITLQKPQSSTLSDPLRDQAYGLTSIIATHKPRLAGACDRILRLAGGRLNARTRVLRITVADAPKPTGMPSCVLKLIGPAPVTLLSPIDTRAPTARQHRSSGRRECRHPPREPGRRH